MYHLISFLLAFSTYMLLVFSSTDCIICFPFHCYWFSSLPLITSMVFCSTLYNVGFLFCPSHYWSSLMSITSLVFSSISSIIYFAFSIDESMDILWILKSGRQKDKADPKVFECWLCHMMDLDLWEDGNPNFHAMKLRCWGSCHLSVW